MRISDWSSDVCSSDLEPLALGDLQRFLRQPVQAFFTARLGVVFGLQDRRSEDLEPYEPDGLGLWSLRDQALLRMIRAADIDGEGAVSFDHTQARQQGQIGRASCRARACLCVEKSLVGV